MEVLPAYMIDAFLMGMASVGVDTAAIRRDAGLPSGPPAHGDRWPRKVLEVAFEQCFRQVTSVNLAVEVGLGVPYGAFGMIDFLIASSDTMGGGLHALAAHYQGQWTMPVLTLVDEPGGVRLEVRPGNSAVPAFSEEFSLAVSLKNLRHIAAAPVPVTEVWVTRADPGSSRLPSLLGAPVRFGAPVGALRFEASAIDLPLRTADPYLRRVVEALGVSLDLGDAPDPFTQAIRARLRDALPHGEPETAAVARTLGMSVRTLHRRLEERGTAWRAVLDAFRRDESMRLLRSRQTSLSEIALALGYSDQSAWTRAFRRWTGMSPSRWLRAARPDSAGRGGSAG